MFAPNPVKAFLSHAKGNDNVYMIAIVLLRRVLERGGDFVPLMGIVIAEISDTQHFASRSLHKLKAGGRISTLPIAQGFDDMFPLPNLVFRALTRIDAGNMDDGFFGGVEDI